MRQIVDSVATAAALSSQLQGMRDKEMCRALWCFTRIWRPASLNNPGKYRGGFTGRLSIVPSILYWNTHLDNWQQVSVIVNLVAQLGHQLVGLQPALHFEHRLVKPAAQKQGGGKGAAKKRQWNRELAQQRDEWAEAA